MSGQAILETVDLTKTYNGTAVVDKLNLRINEGDIFGFLGPNGAGKTTTMLMLLGLTEPTAGVAYVAGHNATRDPLAVKRITGYVPEHIGFYEDLTATQNLAYTARLNGFPESVVTARIGESLNTVGLAKSAEQKVGEFSRGMKQRLAMADILIKEPKVAILDEPTSGIDPRGVNQILDLIGKIAIERKMTVILSSHQLHQVQRICGRVGMLLKGRLVAEGLVDQLGREAFAGGRYTIEVQLAEITERIMKSVKQISGVVSVEKAGGLLLVSCKEDLRPQIAKAVVDAEGLLIGMKIQSYNLEDIYLKYFTES